MKITITLNATHIGSVRQFFNVYRVYAINSVGKISEISWENEMAIVKIPNENCLTFTAQDVCFRDVKTGKESSVLDACCIIGMAIIDSDGIVIPIEHCFAPLWCSECTLEEGDDRFSFESDASRNLWLFVRNVLLLNEYPSRGRYVEQAECATYESFVDTVPSFIPDREDLRILHVLAEHYPLINKEQSRA